MNTADYLDRLLAKYSGTFDIYQPYVINGKEYPAYGYFFSHTEKYVLVREANLWSSDSYEHVLFIETDEITESHINDVHTVIKDYMEPILVRKGEALPAPNHMYSYLTIVLLSQNPVSESVKRIVKRFKFEKGYKFNMRGFSQARIICVTMEDERVISNYAARSAIKLFKDTFNEVKSGKPGYKQLI